MAGGAVARVERTFAAMDLRRRAQERCEFTPDEIADRLERWRPRVLGEMGRRRLWSNVPPAEREDQFQDVAFVLVTRQFRSDEHLLRALWTGLGFRGKDFWKSARRRETSVPEFFDEVMVEDRGVPPEEVAAAAADSRHVEDCLSELDSRERSVYRLMKGEQLGRGRTASALGLTEAEVLRALYTAQRKIDQVAVILTSGRMCARRSAAVRALARSEARGIELDQARAHLSHCTACLHGFREYQAVLGRDVAAIAPVPALALAGHLAAGSSHAAHSLRDTLASLKAHAYNLAGRSPGGSGVAEAAIGGG